MDVGLMWLGCLLNIYKTHRGCMVIHRKDIDKVINAGAKVKADNKGWSIFNLRIRDDMVAGIEEDLGNRAGLTKTAWILEAIQEKLKRLND